MVVDDGVVEERKRLYRPRHCEYHPVPSYARYLCGPRIGVPRAQVKRVPYWIARQGIHSRIDRKAAKVLVRQPLNKTELPAAFQAFAVDTGRPEWEEWKSRLRKAPAVRLDKDSRELLVPELQQKITPHRRYRRGCCHLAHNHVATVYGGTKEMQERLVFAFRLKKRNGQVYFVVVPLAVFGPSKFDEYRDFLCAIGHRNVENMWDSFEAMNFQVDTFIGFDPEKLAPVYEELGYHL